MNSCVSLATLLGYAAAALLGLLVLGLLGALIYLARRLRISIGLADTNHKVKAEAVEANVGASANTSRRKARAKKMQASGASRTEVLIGILLIGVAAVAVGLLIGIVI